MRGTQEGRKEERASATAEEGKSTRDTKNAR